MEIGDKINQCQLDFINKTGKAPKSLYLGHVEMKAFCLWVKDFMELESEPRSSQVMTFLGLKLFEVMSDRHFVMTSQSTDL